MFIPRIYLPSANTTGTTYDLDIERSHYLINVLRLRNLDKIIVFNGLGGEYSAQVLIGKKSAQVLLESFSEVNRESPLSIHLGQALVRGDRMDFAIQKATELGVSHITPIICDKSNVRLAEERSEKRIIHWQKIIISACEQSQRTILPILSPPLLLKEWVTTPFAGPSLFCDPFALQSLKNSKVETTVRIAIGPESGWSPDEIRALELNHFIGTHLGPRILRTETGAMTALALLQGFYGDLS